MSVLHHAASLGDTAVVKAILKAVPKTKREELTNFRDKFGYSPLDWARLGSFDDLIKELSKKKGEAAGIAPVEPLELFSKPVAADEEELAQSSGQCRWDGTTSDCGAVGDAGGWRAPAPEAAPAAWLPAAGMPCAVDAIDASRFDFDIFATHYMLHP